MHTSAKFKGRAQKLFSINQLAVSGKLVELKNRIKKVNPPTLPQLKSIDDT